jgi:hypothetical protein
VSEPEERNAATKKVTPDTCSQSASQKKTKMLRQQRERRREQLGALREAGATQREVVLELELKLEVEEAKKVGTTEESIVGTQVRQQKDMLATPGSRFEEVLDQFRLSPEHARVNAAEREAALTAASAAEEGSRKADD